MSAKRHSPTPLSPSLRPSINTVRWPAENDPAKRVRQPMELLKTDTNANAADDGESDRKREPDLARLGGSSICGQNP
ncbi:MAG: hypothetical protein A4S14_06600 [Proteobacteria bacterium SG_bin9]|nr:MAG: hypothetical protein A4S14_06600 [Proteobacteria bacterium SG_bin9]